MKIKKFLLLLIVICNIIMNSTDIFATDSDIIDIEYISSIVSNAYFLTSNGNLFITGGDSHNYFGETEYIEDISKYTGTNKEKYIINNYYMGFNNGNPFRIATNVKKIKSGYENIYIIKNDNSLWARGRNIYCQDEANVDEGYIYINEFSKIDNNVSNVFCSDDSSNDFLFYTKTDGSLWMIGNCALTGITSIIDNGYTIVPIKVMDNINMVDEEYKKIYILNNDNILYKVINGSIEKIAENISYMKGYNSNEYILTLDNELYILPHEIDNFNEATKVKENINCFYNMDSVSLTTSLIYILNLKGELFKLSIDSNLNIISEKKIFDNIKEFNIEDNSIGLALTNSGELYAISSTDEIPKKISDNIKKIINNIYVLNSDGVGFYAYAYDLTEKFNFNTNGDEFIDISYNKWAEDEINSAINSDIVPAFLQCKYKENITREEFCKLVIKMLITKENTNIDRYIQDNNIVIDKEYFKDTQNKEILLAVSLGIVKGFDDNTFLPNKNITRQEAAVMINNVTKLLHIYGVNNDKKFFDDYDIANWAKESVYNVSTISDKNNNFVISGIGNNKFDPQGLYTREQAIATIYRVFDVYLEEYKS